MKRFKKIFLYVVGTFILLVVMLFFLLKLSIPRTEGEIHLNGIQDRITIKRNHWGIPRIETKNRNDLFFAIGFLHASDRLFQMDMSRRMASGRLSEVFGERTLDSDRYHKDLLIEESIGKTLKKLSPDKAKILQHYCDGVNAFIKSQKLPPEFTVLNYRPEPWTLKDIGSIYKKMEILLADSGSELYNAKIIEALGTEKAEKFTSGIFGTTIINQEEYREIYKNKTLKIAFSNEIKLMENHIGSNSWVISGDKSSSGHPILANDQHLPNIFPSFFYQIYATGDNFELSGNTFPGIPLIIFGRNQNIGWGFTNIGTDVIDYYILEINPENPNQYKLDGKWITFDTIKKKIRIKNKKEIIHNIKLSRFGPVFEEDGRFFARHSVMQYPSTAIDAFVDMDFSRNLNEFLNGVKKFSTPAQNLVFADVDGNIGYFPCGLIPIRKNGNGEIPIQATKSIDLWEGFYNENEKPILLNPEKGYIVTANNPVVPENHLPLFAQTWDPYFRAERIDELIRAKTKLSIEDNKKIQLDCFLKGAEFLISRIKKFTYTSEKANFILEHLKKWDFRTETGIAPYLFYRFEYFINQNTFADHIQDKKLKNLISSSWIYRILNYPGENSKGDDLSFWMDNILTPEKENFKDVVEKSLIDTYHEYARQSRKFDLSWEKLHTLYYQHPLGLFSLFRKFLNRGPYEMPGGSGCILTASFRGNKGFGIGHLSAFRMIMDFSDFSNSLFINSSGQSGHFMSPYYDDQIELFVNLKYRRMEDFKTNLKILKLIPDGR